MKKLYKIGTIIILFELLSVILLYLSGILQDKSKLFMHTLGIICFINLLQYRGIMERKKVTNLAICMIAIISVACIVYAVIILSEYLSS